MIQNSNFPVYEVFEIGDSDTELMENIIDLILNDPEVDTVFEAVDKIITEGIEDVPCLEKTYDALGGSEIARNFLNLFNEEFDITNLYFENDNNFNTTFNIPYEEETYAVTLPFDHPLNINPDGITIIFNTEDNSFLEKSDPFKVSVMFHKIIHAQIVLFLAVLDNNPNLNTQNYTEQAWNEFIESTRNDKGGLFEKYAEALSGNINIISTDVHEIMSTHYIDHMKYVLSEIYPELNDEEKSALAWSGLTETRAFQIEKENYERNNPLPFEVYQNNILGTIELNFSSPGYESFCDE